MATERFNEITGEMVKERPRVPVTVHDIDMPFWSLVVFLVKLALAAIPAAIIVTVLVVVVTAVVGGAIGSSGKRTVDVIDARPAVPQVRPTGPPVPRQPAPPLNASEEIRAIRSLLSQGKYQDAYGRVTALQREDLSAADQRTAIVLQKEAWKGFSRQL
jgi:hypothetical protein